MNFCRRRFNLYLTLVMLALTASGCALWRKERGPTAIVRVHVESESSATGTTKTISVMRGQPVDINIATTAILTEADVVAARLVDNQGSFSVQIQFTETAGWGLEQYTAINPGKHLAIFAQWSDKQGDGRWLAAPFIQRRMAGGSLVFTPDASREEMEELVKGLNINAKKNAVGKDK